VKYQYLTINTGHLSRHDTDVDLMPDVVPKVRELLAAGAGSVPGAVTPGLGYEFTDADMPELAIVSPDMTVWVARFFLRNGDAERSEIARLASLHRTIYAKTGHAAMTPPGLALLLLPGVATANPVDVFMLADFAKTMYAVWALGELGSTQR
jgi:hypothetical protein